MDEKDMARTDVEFKNFVCNSLRDLADKQTTMEAQLAVNTAITEDVAAIVTMGRGMFKFAYRVGSIIRWVGGVGAGVILLWHFFADAVRSLLK